MDICVILDYEVDYECNYTYLNDYVRIGHFDPGSGETSDYIYKYKAVSTGVHK